MLQILQEAEANHFDGIATGDEFYFWDFDPCSKMFVRSPAELIPMMRQGINAKQTMVSVFFSARKIIVLDILLKNSIFN
jgi:hypothetical protein